MKKSVTYVWMSLKILVFIGFIYTSVIMFKLQSISTAIDILYAVAIFLVLNKLDSIDRRLKKIE